MWIPTNEEVWYSLHFSDQILQIRNLWCKVTMTYRFILRGHNNPDPLKESTNLSELQLKKVCCCHSGKWWMHTCILPLDGTLTFPLFCFHAAALMVATDIKIYLKNQAYPHFCIRRYPAMQFQIHNSKLILACTSPRTSSLLRCQILIRPFCCVRCQPPPTPAAPPLLSNGTISYPALTGLTPTGHMVPVSHKQTIPASDSIRPWPWQRLC